MFHVPFSIGSCELNGWDSVKHPEASPAHSLCSIRRPLSFIPVHLKTQLQVKKSPESEHIIMIRNYLGTDPSSITSFLSWSDFYAFPETKFFQKLIILSFIFHLLSRYWSLERCLYSKTVFPGDFLLTNDSLHQNKRKSIINLGKVVHLRWLHSSLAGDHTGFLVWEILYLPFFFSFLIARTYFWYLPQKVFTEYTFLTPCLYAAVFFLSSCLNDSLCSMQNSRLNIVPSKWLGWYFLAFEEPTSLLVNDMCFH